MNLFCEKNTIQNLIENRQVESSVNYVLEDIKKEYRDELLKFIVFVSMNNFLFKGSRRAVGHLSESVKMEVLAEIIRRHKSGIGLMKKIYFKAWLETIKLLPEENKTTELLCFIKHIITTYVLEDSLVSRAKEALDLLDNKTKEDLFFSFFQRKDLVINQKHREWFSYCLRVIDGSQKDEFVSSLIRITLEFSKGETYDDDSILTEILYIGKTPKDFADLKMFEVAKKNIKKLALGSLKYSGKDLAYKISRYMPVEKADEFMHLFNLQ